jgi:hypothetical protein
MDNKNQAKSENESGSQWDYSKLDPALIEKVLKEEEKSNKQINKMIRQERKKGKEIVLLLLGSLVHFFFVVPYRLPHYPEIS